jgi:hypothetical protein
MRVTVRTDRRIERPALGCIVYNGFRQRLCGFSTVNYGQYIEPIDPGEFTFEFRIDLFMPAGAYVCEVTIADLATDPPTLLHTWSEAAKFHVRWAGYSIGGVHDGASEIEFRGQPYSNAAEKARRVALGSGGDAANPGYPFGLLPAPRLGAALWAARPSPARESKRIRMTGRPPPACLVTRSGPHGL